MGPVWKAIYHPPICQLPSLSPFTAWMSLSQPQLVLSHTPRSPKWAVSSPPFSFWRPRRVSWHFQTTDQIRLPSLLFSDISPLLRQIEIKPQRTSCYWPLAQLQTSMAAGGRQMWKETESYRKALALTDRQELWERAQFDMRISFCKHLKQSVSGYWHPGVLQSQIFTDTKFQVRAQDL